MKAWFAVLMVGIFVFGMTAQENLGLLLPEEYPNPQWWKVGVAVMVATSNSGLAWYAARNKETE